MDLRGLFSISFGFWLAGGLFVGLLARGFLVFVFVLAFVTGAGFCFGVGVSRWFWCVFVDGGGLLVFLVRCLWAV